ncbi:redox-sensing transcriptional repressor Rex [Kitasatospora sp. NPDC048540]|uniref:redox-sensing transcriptional repressor Rex n=1 Tax=unclassified Kitasatospora TaxID=2633591 RepID=UPI00053BB801|nr:redox-sensing transcriptional repressor Rex [Kitasatospora sp. MBT63]
MAIGRPTQSSSQTPDAGAARRPSRARGIPEATVARLPLYLRALTALSERSVPTVSSEELATAAGVNSAKLRKDFSYLGSYGTRGVGYDVEYLVYQISRELGLTQDWPVVIVGIGNLGHALANYGGFASRGFRVAALLDADPAVVGSTAAGLPVRHMDELEAIVAGQQVSIGVITTPPGAAQQVCDRLVEAGVTSILNFAPTVLTVPDGVDVRKVDLSIELQILAFHEQRKAGEEPGQDGGMLDRAPGPVRAAAAKLRRAAGGAKGEPAKTEAAKTRSGKGTDGDRSAVMPA